MRSAGGERSHNKGFRAGGENGAGDDGFSGLGESMRFNTTNGILLN